MFYVKDDFKSDLNWSNAIEITAKISLHWIPPVANEEVKWDNNF